MFLCNSCGFLAWIDPPKQKDFLKYTLPNNDFVNFYDSNSIYLAKDTFCGGDYFLIEFGLNKVYWASYDGDTTKEFTLNFYKTNTKKEFNKYNFGYLKQGSKDTFECELQWRDAPWNRRFIVLKIIKLSPTSFKIINKGVRPYKYHRTYLSYFCELDREIYFYKME